MAAPARTTRIIRITPGESYRRHVQRKKVIALIAGLLLLPVSIFMIASFDRGPLGQAVAGALGFSPAGLRPQPAPTTSVVALAPSPTAVACLDTVFNGRVVDAETGAPLGDVRVSASFGGGALTSTDGEYKIAVCYDPAIHDGFSLVFERAGYESGSLDVVTTGYPGLGYRIDDMGLYSIATPAPPEPPTPRPPRSPTATSAPPAGPGAAPTTAPAATPTTAATPSTLPETGLTMPPFPGQAIGFVLLAISLMLIAAGLWPERGNGGRTY
jgi:hypothetical protein